MIIYTDLAENSLIFRRLKAVGMAYGITLKSGVISASNSKLQADFEKKKALFWFSKSNSKHLIYYRVCDALGNIWKGLVILENHSELIK